MELIDRDELKKYAYDSEQWYGSGTQMVVDVEDIDNAPIIDSVPVVHGKWLHDESGANFCSECMKYAYEDEEYHMIWHTQYCPHCGAKMEKPVGDSDKLKDGELDAIG